MSAELTRTNGCAFAICFQKLKYVPEVPNYESSSKRAVADEELQFELEAQRKRAEEAEARYADIAASNAAQQKELNEMNARQAIIEKDLAMLRNQRYNDNAAISCVDMHSYLF
ncbi:OLC1v1018720C1 [Oldenlandia corymbosa var. corymbosa]|uniref:OLC1v1018720C1 n=1 Tax=Oldenlandia corymbosa var. corymbosa TaxID=529605 RepID=A0AAV1EC78_OLDCO|nr:OLC1v1018720C1 [Oldenlandia corymbosa var. corymbosa]